MTATGTPTPVLQARGLVKRYGQVTAIDGADFDLLPGEVLAVIGDNGAGKTSLIKALTGAVTPDSRRDTPGRRTHHLLRTAERPRPRHRDGVPGPRRGRLHGHRLEHVSRP